MIRTFVTPCYAYHTSYCENNNRCETHFQHQSNGKQNFFNLAATFRVCLSILLLAGSIYTSRGCCSLCPGFGGREENLFYRTNADGLLETSAGWFQSHGRAQGTKSRSSLRYWAGGGGGDVDSPSAVLMIAIRKVDCDPGE